VEVGEQFREPGQDDAEDPPDELVARLGPPSPPGLPRVPFPEPLRTTAISVDAWQGLGAAMQNRLARQMQDNPRAPKHNFLVPLRGQLQKHKKEAEWYALHHPEWYCAGPIAHGIPSSGTRSQDTPTRPTDWSISYSKLRVRALTLVMSLRWH
jgi:hypothetical protein